MCSKDRDPTGDITESERPHHRGHLDVGDVGDVGEVVDEEAAISPEAVGGPGGPEVEEGEGTREGARKSGEGSPEGGGEG